MSNQTPPRLSIHVTVEDLAQQVYKAAQRM